MFKHFRSNGRHFQVEEKILESLAWRSGSPLWTAIESNGQPIPKCEDVLLPSQLMDENDLKAAQISSNNMNPVIHRISNSGMSCIFLKARDRKRTGM